MTESKSPVRIYLCELTHTYVTVAAKNSPLAIGYLASYLKANLSDALDVRLFKYPRNLNDALDRQYPDIVGFSNFMWNAELSYSFAREIKRNSPTTAVVFGGPNYPTKNVEQSEFLANHPEIDFYVEGEGETALLSIVSALVNNDFDVQAAKTDLANVRGVHFSSSNSFVLNGTATRVSDIEQNLPSPYLTGLMDEFFDKDLTPLMQTSRGCPYSCTFCVSGTPAASKVYRFSNERIFHELSYLAIRTRVPSLTIADLNWGAFSQDIAVARFIKEVQNKSEWPQNIQADYAKNQKDRIVTMARILGSAMAIGASIQSSDAGVLANIKRKNISQDTIVKMAMESAGTDSLSFTEIILCLPGDTREKHERAVYDMLAAGINNILSYQFILLPGTEAASRKSVEEFGYQTAYRVLTRCFGNYQIGNSIELVTEIQEVVVGNLTMSHADYLECRKFDLTLTIFNNGKILDELYLSVAHLGVSRSQLIREIHARATAKDSSLNNIYESFTREEEGNFWSSKDSLLHYLYNENGLESYISGEKGRNEMHHWKSVAIFQRLPEVVDCAILAIEGLLCNAVCHSDDFKRYLADLRRLILFKRNDPTNLDEEFRFYSNFDFAALEKSNYSLNPVDCMTTESKSFSVSHTDSAKGTILAYFDQFGSDLNGLAHMTQRFPVHTFFRNVFSS